MFNASYPSRNSAPVTALPTLLCILCALRIASTHITAAPRPLFQYTVPTRLVSLKFPLPAPYTLSLIFFTKGKSVPGRAFATTYVPFAESPAGTMSSSAPPKVTYIILVLGKLIRAAFVIAVEFIPEPAPQNVTQSGFSFLICNHCDCCSSPGGAIAISINLKPQSAAIFLIAGNGSRPYAESMCR